MSHTPTLDALVAELVEKMPAEIREVLVDSLRKEEQNGRPVSGVEVRCTDPAKNVVSGAHFWDFSIPPETLVAIREELGVPAPRDDDD